MKNSAVMRQDEMEEEGENYILRLSPSVEVTPIKVQIAFPEKFVLSPSKLWGSRFIPPALLCVSVDHLRLFDS